MIHEFTTDKGLKVIGVESHKSPVVSVQMWVRNGSADERQGEEGLSHFIEHLVFKGSRKFKVGEIASVVEGCGGELNAYTSFDQTVYYVTISSHFFDKALEVVSEMVAYPTFDKEEIDKEREVVVEEIKRSQDSLGRRASRLLFSELYPGYPYSLPVIGYEEVVRNTTRDKIVDFFKERYVARNMFLVVSGNFKGDELKRKVDEHFNGLANTAPKLPVRPPAQMLEERKVLVEKTNFKEAIFHLAWPAGNIFDEDLPALECLSLILGQGASSRLSLHLKMRKNLVNSISAGSWAPPTRGFFSISGSLNPEHFGEALAAIREEIETLFLNGITDEELNKAKTNFLSEEAYSLETVGGLARKFGGDFDATHNMFFHADYLKKLSQVNASDVMAAARKYLDPKKGLLAAVVPDDVTGVEEQLKNWTFNTPALKGQASTVRQAFSLKSVEGDDASDGQVRLNVTDNGLRSFYRRNTAAPVFHVRWASLGGARVLPPGQEGLSELSGRVWSAQTKKITEGEMREKLDSLASSVYSYAGRNTFGLVVDGLSTFQKELAEIFKDTVLNADIDPAILEREKKVLLEALRSRQDSPSSVAALNFQKELFGAHPYGRDQLGTAETLGKITADDVRTHISTYFKMPTSRVASCGFFDEKLWNGVFEEISAATGGGQTPLPSFKHPDLTANKYIYEKAEKEQANLIYGFKGLAMDDPDRFVLQVIEAVLAGQGGRLFIELRDKASLAYSVSPMKMEGMETGYFAAYIGCSPEKTETAIKMMRVEFDKMMQTKISEDELARAKRYLIGGHDIGLQKNAAIASSIAFNDIYGLSLDEVFRYADFLLPATTEDVQRVSQKIFSSNYVLSVVGPREVDGYS